MPTINAVLARLGIHHTTLARWMAQLQIEPQSVLPLDGRYRTITDDQLQQLVALQREKEALRRGVAHPANTQEGRANNLPPAASAEYRRPVRPRARVATRPIGSTETLPGGLVSWRSFAGVHHIPETTVQKAIADGRLAVVRGRWKLGRNYVEGALDEQGRRQFVKLWGHRPDFAQCADCPHDTKPSTPA